MREGPSQRGHQRVFAAEKCFMPAAPHYRSRGEDLCERSTPTQGRVLPSTSLCSPTTLILPIILEMPHIPDKNNSYPALQNLNTWYEDIEPYCSHDCMEKAHYRHNTFSGEEGWKEDTLPLLDQ